MQEEKKLQANFSLTMTFLSFILELIKASYLCYPHPQNKDKDHVKGTFCSDF